jgi:hypothetical protein
MLPRYWPFLLVVLATGCSSGRPASKEGTPPTIAPDGSPPTAADTGASAVAFDLYEPVVRHLMKPLEAEAPPRPWVVYVNVPVGLSVEAFCERFAGSPIPVLPFGDAALDSAEQSAYIIHICNPSARKICWEGPDQASILVSHHAASAPFCGCDRPAPVPVRRDGGQWVVVEP